MTTDGSDAAELAAPHAAALGGRHGARIHALNVVDLETEAGPFSAGGLTEAEVERYEKRGQEAVVRDRPHAGIRSYAEEYGVDVVVMSSIGGSSLVGQLLGSVADRTLRVVDIPVLVVAADAG